MTDGPADLVDDDPAEPAGGPAKPADGPAEGAGGLPAAPGHPAGAPEEAVAAMVARASADVVLEAGVVPSVAPDAAEALVARLRRLDACAVSDACDRLGLADRVVTGLAPLTGPAQVAGRVITVQLGPWSGGGATRHLCAAATDAATPADVLVVAHSGRTDCAGWGGNLSRAARARGAAATIVDGAARDIDESRAVGYPVFAAAATPRTARGRTEETAWNVPVVIAGVAVEPGDHVVADSTGIVFLPAARTAEILEAAEAIAAREATMAASLDAGQPVSEVMGADYETMLRSPASDR